MFLCLSPKRMSSSAVPLSFIMDIVRYCWTREFPVVFVGKHRTSFVVLVKDAYNSHNSFSLTAKLSIIRGLGIFPNKHFPAFPFLRRAGKLHLYRQMPSLPSNSISIIRNSRYDKKCPLSRTENALFKQEAASSHTGNGSYLSSFISSSMARSIAGRYLSGQSCTLYFTR